MKELINSPSNLFKFIYLDLIKYLHTETLQKYQYQSSLNLKMGKESNVSL